MSRKKIKHLVVAAYHKELAPLCRMGSKHFVIKKDVAYLAAGIGPMAAAFGLAHFLEDYRPKLIVGIGTAGIVNSKLKIGDIVIGKSVSIGSNPLSLDPSPRREREKLPQVNIFSPQEISRTAALRQQLHTAGYDVENLEAYAFAFVAKKFRIPFVSLLGLTNYVGPKVHAEWVKNEGRLCEKLAKEVKKIGLTC